MITHGCALVKPWCVAKASGSGRKASQATMYDEDHTEM